MTLTQSLKDCIEYDDARESVRGEHMMTAIGGLALAVCALRTHDKLHSTLHAMAAGALLMRAASGRDGLRKLAGAGQATDKEATANTSATP